MNAARESHLLTVSASGLVRGKPDGCPPPGLSSRGRAGKPSPFHDTTKPRRREPRFPGRILLNLTLLALALAPSLLNAGSFVVDDGSPSWPNSYDILRDSPEPWSELPRLGVSGDDLGLQAGDVVDALSNGRDPIDGANHAGEMKLIFSVRRTSDGRPNTAVRAEKVGDTAPPGGPDGAASDLFIWSGVLGSNELAAAPLGWRLGTQSGDESNAHLRTPGNNHKGDNVIAYDRSTMYFQGSGDGGHFWEPGHPDNEIFDPEHENPDIPGIPPAIGGDGESSVGLPATFFSLRTGSPTLAAIGAAPGDLLAVGGPFGPTPQIFVSHATLGLPPEADVDSLNLEVRQLGVGLPVPHRVRFSVNRYTDGFALPDNTVVESGADILLYDGATTSVVHRAAELGLRAEDDIDALESAVTRGDPNLGGVIIELFGDCIVQPLPDGDGVEIANIGWSGDDGAAIETGARDPDGFSIRPVAPPESFVDLLGTAWYLVAEIDVGRNPTQAVVGARLWGLEDGRVGIKIAWGRAASQVHAEAYTNGEPSGQAQSPAGDVGTFADGMQLVEIQADGQGFRFRFAREISLTTATGDELRGDEFRFRHRSAELDSAALAQLRVFGAGLGAVTLTRPDRVAIFRRGDTDGNAQVEITDAILTLAWMFLGQGQIHCFDAADSDDNGALEISDPISTVSHLFLGSSAIPAPATQNCGVDPTPDALDCESYDTCD